MQAEHLDNGVSVLPPGSVELDAQPVSPKYCQCNRYSVEHDAGKCVKKPEFNVRRFEVGDIWVCDNCLVSGDQVL